MIARRTVVVLGLSQLVCWGISYYLIGVFGDLIAADLGWSGSLVYGGFSAALVMMGLSSPVTGRLIDRYGGRAVMAAGSCLTALGCAGLALSQGPVAFYAAWLCMGLAMRLTLYDAAFATLARLGGPGAKGPMSQITLLGGLASTVFWPIGYCLATQLGWRGALFVYAGIALCTVLLHLAIPAGRYETAPAREGAEVPQLAAGRADRLVAGALYAVIVTLVNFLNAGLSAHMIGILTGLGVAASLSVWISTLRGIGQTTARLCDVLSGSRLHALNLNLLAMTILPFCFAAGLLSGQFVAAAIAFAFFYGAGNGLATITRGTLPLVLFDHRTYGAFLGRLLMPSFLLASIAPLTYAVVIEAFGEAAGLYLSVGIAVVMLAAAVALRVRFLKPQRAQRRDAS